MAGLLGCITTLTAAQTAKLPVAPDGDRDGLTDRLESELLDQFKPRWMIGKEDCSVKPGRFASGAVIPTVLDDDGTIYGQASPYRGRKDEVELHFYHLWRQDCGEMGHPLDAEHVAVLVRYEADDYGKPRWWALYWYAAAHEDTVCDASQITRASTVKAVEEGVTVWISPGKHASFLNQELCTHGCGGDRCTDMDRMKTGKVINLENFRSRWMARSGWRRRAGRWRTRCDAATFQRRG